MTPLTVPVGLYLGAFPDEDDPDGGHEVRRGGEVEVLTAAEFTTWMLAHDGSGTATDSADSGLRERGLLVEIATSDGVEAFARAYRMLPLLLGLGRSERRAEWFGVGLPGRELVTLAPLTYEVWARSAAYPTLWDTCESLVENGDGAEPVLLRQQVLDACVADLHCLLGSAGAYIDLAPGGDR